VFACFYIGRLLSFWSQVRRTPVPSKSDAGFSYGLFRISVEALPALGCCILMVILKKSDVDLRWSRTFRRSSSHTNQRLCSSCESPQKERISINLGCRSSVAFHRRLHLEVRFHSVLVAGRSLEGHVRTDRSCRSLISYHRCLHLKSDEVNSPGASRLLPAQIFDEKRNALVYVANSTRFQVRDFVPQ
jgi:hypothetical protein